jgi:hypothetical protein
MEAMSEEQPPLTPAQKVRERIYAIIAISLVVMFLGCSGLITALELPLRLLLGWAWHLVQAAPALLLQWHKLLMPLGCLALAMWLVHRFIRWWISAKGSKVDWRTGNTLAAIFLLLLGSAAAIALSGVVHQAVWLADVPWWSNGRRSERRESMGKIQQLHLAIFNFHDRHGRFPDSLAELDLKQSANLLYQSPAHGEPPEPIIYLKPLEMPTILDRGDKDDIIILVSPLLEEDRDRIAVGFISGATRSMYRHQLPETLETRRMPSTDKP